MRALVRKTDKAGPNDLYNTPNILHELYQVPTDVTGVMSVAACIDITRADSALVWSPIRSSGIEHPSDRLLFGAVLEQWRSAGFLRQVPERLRWAYGC